MTTSDLRSLLEARREELERERESAHALWMRHDDELSARRGEIIRVLDLLSADIPSPSPAPAETPTPEKAPREKPTLERCLEDLHRWFGVFGTIAPPPFRDDEVRIMGFQRRTIRKALGKMVDAGELTLGDDGLYRYRPPSSESRASDRNSAPSIATERARTAVAETEPPTGGAGADDEPMPDFLPRIPRAAE